MLRPGKFDVRMRNGFYGVVSDNRSKPVSATAREQILHTLISPFGSADVPIRLTSLFANDAKAGSFMRSLLHVDGNALTFTDGKLQPPKIFSTFYIPSQLVQSYIRRVLLILSTIWPHDFCDSRVRPLRHINRYI